MEADEQFGDEAPYDVNPEDFVKYIKDATYVLTDSFHCSAFSIQFHNWYDYSCKLSHNLFSCSY